MRTYILKLSTLLFITIISVAQVSCQNSTKQNNSSSANVAMKKKFPKAKSASQWKKELSPTEYQIMVKKGTEPAFNNPYYDNHREGVYVSAATGDTLFSSKDKFESGTGWPSFTKPVKDDAVIWVKDNSLGMTRNEVIEKSTGLHLGHVFEDGPQPTGLRYCMNSAALKFVPKDSIK